MIELVLLKEETPETLLALSLHTHSGERPYELTYSKKAAIDKARRELSFGSDHVAP